MSAVKVSKKLLTFGFCKVDPDNLDMDMIDSIGGSEDVVEEQERFIRTSRSKTFKNVRSLLSIDRLPGGN